jgi:hypothetical protein
METQVLLETLRFPCDLSRDHSSLVSKVESLPWRLLVEIIRTDRKTIMLISFKYQPTITRNATKSNIKNLRMLL